MSSVIPAVDDAIVKSNYHIRPVLEGVYPYVPYYPARSAPSNLVGSHCAGRKWLVDCDASGSISRFWPAMSLLGMRIDLSKLDEGILVALASFAGVTDVTVPFLFSIMEATGVTDQESLKSYLQAVIHEY